MEQLVIVMEADKPDHHGVIYPQELLASAVDDFLERMKVQNHSIPGECSPPPMDENTPPERLQQVDLERASHLVKNMWMEDKIVKAKISMVGKYAELAEAGLEYSVIPRAFGSIGADKVCSKYVLITLDLAYSED